jgi:integral peroxisomal membrane peroxin (PEX24)
VAWLEAQSSPPAPSSTAAAEGPQQGLVTAVDPTALLRTFATRDISLSPDSEKRQVEIFELHYRPLYAPHSEWTPVLFSPVPYTPLSPGRIAGHRPTGAKAFEDVRPPDGWRWTDKKWSLDLLAREWVEERLISGVEVEVEGGRWVVDVNEEIIKSEEDVVGAGEESATAKKRGYQVGEWRRRRWIRMVERAVVETAEPEVLSVL